MYRSTYRRFEVVFRVWGGSSPHYPVRSGGGEGKGLSYAAAKSATVMSIGDCPMTEVGWGSLLAALGERGSRECFDAKSGSTTSGSVASMLVEKLLDAAGAEVQVDVGQPGELHYSFSVAVARMPAGGNSQPLFLGCKFTSWR